MAEVRTVKAKVCLVGEIAVGKTSLVRRFSEGSFDQRYSTTLGINISKKVIEPRNPQPGMPQRVEMVLYDVMGQRSLRPMLAEAYFKGAQAVLAVWDVMRPETLNELPIWIEMAREAAGPIPVVIASNKSDLTPDRELDHSALETVAREAGAECFTTSAKTGENVGAAFERIADELMRRHVRAPRVKDRAGPASDPDRVATRSADGRV